MKNVTIHNIKLSEIIKNQIKDISGVYSDSTECIFQGEGYQIHITATRDKDYFLENSSEAIEIE